MLLSRLHHPVRNLGFGVRAGIWFQGCTLYCRGCVSRDTWAFDGSRRCDVEAVLAWLDGLGALDGITISGGEPTDQPAALRTLLEALKDRDDDTDVLMFSGRTYERLRVDVPWLWDGLVDLLISDPFEQDRVDDVALRGSTNQRVHRLTDLGQRRYPEEDFEQRYSAQRQQISVNVDEQSVWMVGIPKPGDLARVRDSLEARGVSVGRTSWLS
ncbi:radical SAM protein [Mycobacterium intermedium]|uniref:Radical SAM protein n=1 Tax=Mycobacterium intermedium TaxID=28445 RepID=A0A1E3SHB9_MYCIE|nr:4Fe-4S single cluster domain-containing protein [Mycobacterium intermedium]ODR01043.1 radical SAM protein [Mycobacterium intermedium]OPE52440.1 radical SAM protein [Mycobacterium intermedium]ORB10534.1 radical SAM protein [Mycobacterium intermedium]